MKKETLKNILTIIRYLVTAIIGYLSNGTIL